MGRYFGKIDESKKSIYWDLDKATNDVLVKLPPTINQSRHCLSMHGNLFIVLDEIKDSNYKVLFVSESSEGMKDYFNFDEFTATDAYYWARDIGDRDIMITKITDSQYAYWWAKYIGNKNVMIDKITGSYYAYHWAAHIGDKEIMKERITDEDWIKEFEKLP